MKKKFQCTQCSDDFSHANDLAIHLSVHSKDGTMKCNICDKTFIRKFIALYILRFYLLQFLLVYINSKSILFFRYEDFETSY